MVDLSLGSAEKKFKSKPCKPCLEYNTDSYSGCKGYEDRLEGIRIREYPHLNGCIYLDHAGSTLYAKSLIEAHSKDLVGNLYGNPHSKSGASQRSDKIIENARQLVLDMFKLDKTEYSVVFCQNATAAVKLIAEGVASLEGSTTYIYHEESHTSLIGLREYATSFKAATESNFTHDISSAITDQNDSQILCSWPAQSNFSGKRFPSKSYLDRINTLQNSNPQKNVYSILDISSIASCHPSACFFRPYKGPDFMVLSFYKIFGYPDLGALIVKQSTGAAFFANRKYFGGGTVESLTLNAKFAPRKRSLDACLEDGTLPFHSILALVRAFEVHGSIYGSFDSISHHVTVLGRLLYDKLCELYHINGRKLCQIYTDQDYSNADTQGPIIAMNLIDCHGAWIGYSEVESALSAYNISIRTGTLCNTGGSAKWIGYSEYDIMNNHIKNGHVCGDSQDIIAGKPTGALRVSLGAMSTVEDINKLIDCLSQNFLSDSVLNDIRTDQAIETHTPDAVHVSSVTLFPIKSCGGFNVPEGTEWPITPSGLKYDREFCVTNLASGSVMSLKKYPQMALIRPTINLESGTMQIKFVTDVSANSITIPLDPANRTNLKSMSLPSRVCGDGIETMVLLDSEIVSFFSNTLGVHCSLATLVNDRYIKSTSGRVPIGMANNSPFLLISMASVNKLNLVAPGPVAIHESVFRANIIIEGSGLDPYAEDSWKTLTIGGVRYRMMGSCARCKMVSVDPEMGTFNQAPLQALQKSRRLQGKIWFGQHMEIDGQGDLGQRDLRGLYIKVGDKLEYLS